MSPNTELSSTQVHHSDIYTCFSHCTNVPLLSEQVELPLHVGKNNANMKKLSEHREAQRLYETCMHLFSFYPFNHMMNP